MCNVVCGTKEDMPYALLLCLIYHTEWVVFEVPDEEPKGSNAVVSNEALLLVGTADAGLAGCDSDPNGSDENGSVL